MGDKQIDSLGRIVIPKEIRNQLGLHSGEKISFRVDSEKRILMIEKNKENCFLCSSTENLIKVKNGFFICKACVHEIKPK